MSHYEKLATVLLRAFASGVILFALGGIASSAMFAVISKELFAFSGVYYIFTYGAYGVAGLALLAGSRPLANLIAGRL